jgi:hypothetical protein
MSWDVFVSHSRQDKPWVRVFVQQLRGLGLQVFFDEDSVAVGGEFQSEVTKAIMESRSCVFIISSASVLSPWVADEINTALHYRAAGGHQLRNIIPVYLESVSFDHPGLDTAASVYLTEKNQRNEKYRRLLDGIVSGSDLGSDLPPVDSLTKSLPWPGSRDPSGTLKINNGGRAIAIGAHWDDILLGCLGTLLRLQLLHDYTVTVAVLCNTYADRYYDQPQEGLLSKINHIYEELKQRFAINFIMSDVAQIMDRSFRDKEDRVEARVTALAQEYSDCDLIFTTSFDDGHIDHAVTGRLVQSHFLQPEQTVLDYEVKRHTDRSFVPNIFVNLDSPSPDGGYLGALKVRLLSGLVVDGKDLRGVATRTEIAGSDYVFGQQPLEARLLINALDQSGYKNIKYGEVFRGRISL